MNASTRSTMRSTAALLLMAIGCAQADYSSEPRLVIQTGHSATQIRRETAGLIPIVGTGHLVSYTENETILWDADSTTELRRFPTDRVYQTGDSSLLLPGLRKGYSESSGMKAETTVAVLWDARSGRVVRAIDFGFASSTAHTEFAQRLDYVGSYGSSGLAIWDLKTGNRVFHYEPKGEGIAKLAFSIDSRRIAASTSKGSVLVWDTRSWQRIYEHAGHQKGGGALAFSRDGRVIASSGEDPTVVLHDIDAGSEQRRMSVDMVPRSLAFDRAGRRLAAAGYPDSDGGRLVILDAVTGTRLHSFKTGEWGIPALLWLDASDWLASIVDDSDSRTKIRIRNPATGELIKELYGAQKAAASVAVSPEQGMWATSGGSRDLSFWRTDQGSAVTLKLDLIGQNQPLFFTDGSFGLLVSLPGVVGLMDTKTREPRVIASNPGGLYQASFDPAISLVVYSDLSGSAVTANDVKTSRQIWSRKLYPDASRRITATAVSHDGSRVAVGSVEGLGSATVVTGTAGIRAAMVDGPALQLLDAHSGKVLQNLQRSSRLPNHVLGVSALAFLSDGRSLIAAYDDGFLTVWNIASGREEFSFPGAARDIACLPDAKRCVSANGDRLKLWDLERRESIADLFVFEDGGWMVVDKEGRFDANDLEKARKVFWFLPDGPLTPLPIEIFMRDYYEPRLLTRILNGEKFKPVRALAELNRVQPVVKIVRVAQDAKEPDAALVEVEFSGASQDYARNGKMVAVSTAVHNLRLFRNGQLVGYADGKLADAGASPVRRTFSVRVPSESNSSSFTAYAFNDDGVKSATAERTISTELVRTERPRAYIVAIGVNRHENSAWNLEYAANDARRFTETLLPRLESQGRYQEIIPISMISEANGSNLATKANIKAVFDRLSGRKADVSAISNGEKLRRVTPNDLVLISFSGHGVSHDGQFYLIPSDTGQGQGRRVVPELLSRAVSSDELANWLRDVDAGDIAMIIDACQSAASVGSEFKPGPMGARGLGQLAYEKGMRILAASQAEQDAQESKLTQQGLLSYALVNDGLEKNRADYQPMDRRITLSEWLSYGMQRVPALAEEVARGRLENRGRGDARSLVRVVEGDRARLALQQPALFDFIKGRRDTTVAAIVSRD